MRRHRGIELRVRHRSSDGTWSDVLNVDSDALFIVGKFGGMASEDGWGELLTINGEAASSLPFAIEHRPVMLPDPMEDEEEEGEDAGMDHRWVKVAPVPMTFAAEPMATQHDPRPPLCVWCVMAMYYSASTISITTKRPLTIASLNGMEIPARQQTPLYGELAGHPERFVLVARELGLDPDITWMINQSHVGVFAEMELFGTKVCTAHLHDALQSWQSGNKIPGGWR